MLPPTLMVFWDLGSIKFPISILHKREKSFNNAGRFITITIFTFAFLFHRAGTKSPNFHCECHSMNRRLSRSKNNHCQWALIMFTKLSCDCLASLLLYVFICNDYLRLIVLFLFRLDHGFWSTALFPFCLN